jgi:hypothetical protein
MKEFAREGEKNNPKNCLIEKKIYKILGTGLRGITELLAIQLSYV